ncbi:hypothetical protein GALMADRAFT_82220, partial [Galerina marginata CBS 339.88]
LVHNVMMNQNEAFAWEDSERGTFREDFFPPVVIPTVEHTPWVYKNIPIPPGLYDEVCRIIKSKRDSGVYQASNSLEPLNAVTIAHSGVPPATEDLATHFAGRACGHL